MFNSLKIIYQNHSPNMTNVFTYGSLMFREVIYALTSIKDYKSSRAILRGYSRYQVKGKVYPGITADAQGEIQGVVYFDVTKQDLEILNQFENVQYVPTEVELSTAEGTVKAIAYVYADPSNLSGLPWDAEEFQKKYKQTFAKQHLISQQE